MTPSSSSEGFDYSSEQVHNFIDEIQKLRNAQPGVQLDLSHLSEQLTVQRAKTYANEALGTR
jgi:hypothetical protein